MSKVSFNVDAYTARLIGRENVAKLNGAILELVKNTYDADASVCFIYFDENKQEVYIGDNGCGMTSEIICTNWMTIGRSSKKERYISKAGRVQTGAKGIGRFALDRIADQCTMLTISDSEGGYTWTVDWRDFERESEITDVSADLSPANISFIDFAHQIKNEDLRKLIREKFNNHGTIFKLSMLRDEWNTARLDDLKNELNSLIPSEMSNIFQIYLFDNKSLLNSATVLHNNEDFFYDYKIHFDVNDEGRSRIQIYRNEFDFQDKFEYIMQNANFSQDDQKYFNGKPMENISTLSKIIFRQQGTIENPIGSFHGTFYFAKLSITKKDKRIYYYKDITTRKEFRNIFGGIKIYRDQFRVRPYGEVSSSNYDWLQLSARKSSSPAAVSHTGSWRVRENQMIGSIFISRTNLTLPDQANREGIIETDEFGLLKSYLLYVIGLLEKDRQYVCRKLAELNKKENPTEQIAKEIKEIAEKEKKENDYHDASAQNQKFDYTNNIPARDAQRVIEFKEAEIRNLEDENRLLRVLATTGIATNAYVHEFRTQTHGLSMHIVTAKEALEKRNNSRSALMHLIAANKIRESFNSWFRVTIESVRRDKRTQRNINLNGYLRAMCEAWQSVIAENNIDIEFQETNKQTTFRCFPYEFDLIISNLITNSVAAFGADASCKEKNIKIRLLEAEDSICIEYSDNGPGLPSAYKEDPRLILEPHETSRKNNQGETIGTGLGMWLIYRTILEYNGTIDLSHNQSKETGFYARIQLPSNAFERK